jgi:hypothetical protein
MTTRLNSQILEPSAVGARRSAVAVSARNRQRLGSLGGFERQEHL